MKKTDIEASVERGKAHFMETLGNIPEPIRAMMQFVPDHFSGYLQFRETVYQSDPAEGHLDLKTKEMLYTLLDIVTGNLEGAKNHGRAAFEAGMTSRELAEGCMQVMHVCGVTTWGKTGYKVVDFIAELEAQKP
ncbi:MAG: carboxymuconolactone decarboxylase family protein [Kiloniellales bacterium]|nr:carboxymuconolactone decarboxylase family protein [Kiloniellales bacterium]